MNPLKITGGTRIGNSNATWPFATLTVMEDRLDLNASLIGKFSFAKDEVLSIEPVFSLSFIGNGIRINHKVPQYKVKIIFWTFKNPVVLLENIKETGFFDANSFAGILNRKEQVIARQQQSGSPIKKHVVILSLIVWNGLFLYDLIPFFLGHTRRRTPFGFGINLALGLLFGASLLTAISEGFRQQILKKGVAFNDVKKSIYFLVIISGIMLISYTTTKHQ